MNCNKEDDGVDVFQCQDEVPNDVEATIVKTPYSPMVTCRIDGVELSGMCNVQMAKVFEKVCIDDLKGGDDKKLVTAKDLHATHSCPVDKMVFLMISWEFSNKWEKLMP